MRFHPIVPAFVVIGPAAVGVVVCTVAGWRSRRRLAWLRRALAVVLLALVAARPGSAPRQAAGLGSDLDVYFVIDRTASMVAEDHDGSRPRFDGVRADVVAIARALPGARFSLVGFDNDVQTMLPLVSDVTALVNAVDVMRPEVTAYSSGSSPRLPVAYLQETMTTSTEDEPDRRRIVFLVTDGEATVAAPDAPTFDAVADVIDGGAVLGYGSTTGGRMRGWDGVERTAQPFIIDPETGEEAVSRIDERELEAMADELDVPYVHREGPGGIRAALTAVDASGRQATGAELPVRDDRGWVFALALLTLVLWEAAVVARDVTQAMAALPGDAGRSWPLLRWRSPDRPLDGVDP